MSTAKRAKARVLVVDDNDRVRSRLERGLSDEGYTVCVVGGNSQQLFKSALRAARRFRPHVAIVDLRLTDNADTSDTSGLDLLKKLKSESQGVKLIAYSAYLNPTIDRELSDVGATWVDKSDSPQLLKQKVADFAAAASAESRSFTVLWPRKWNIQSTLDNLFKKAPPESLVNDVLSQLFPRFRRLNVHHIENRDTPSASPVSRGRSLVVRVTPEGARAKKIVKIARPKRITRESRNYRRHVVDQVVGVFHTQLENSSTFWDVGASVYTFLGTGGEGGLQTFGDFYADAHDVNGLLDPLLSFFGEAWSTDVEETKTAWSIIAQYDRLLGFKKNQTRIVQQDRLVSLTANRCNPVEWMVQNGLRCLPLTTHRGRVHGDFHADNLFTDGKHLWVVDFERTGSGPVFADFCELEVDLLTRILPNAVPHKEFCALVNALLFPSEQWPGDIATSGESAKMLNFLRRLREHAMLLTHCSSQIEYEWGAFCDCIFVLGMKQSAATGEDQIVQRERAWLYACELTHKIECLTDVKHLKQV